MLGELFLFFLAGFEPLVLYSHSSAKFSVDITNAVMHKLAQNNLSSLKLLS